MHSVQTLTPVNNVSVGELIPVSITDEAHSEEDSLSVPSYSEASLQITNQPLLCSWVTGLNLTWAVLVW